MHSTNNFTASTTTAYHSYLTTTGAPVTSASPTHQPPITAAVSSESKDGSGCARWSKPQFDRGSGGGGVDRGLVGANKRYPGAERLHLTSDTEAELTNTATTASNVITATTLKLFKSFPAKNYCLSNDKDNIKNEVDITGNHDINDKGLCDIDLKSNDDDDIKLSYDSSTLTSKSFQFYQTKSNKRKTFLKNDFKTATTNFFQRSGHSTNHYLPLAPSSLLGPLSLSTPSTTSVLSGHKLKKGPKRRTGLRSRKFKILPKLIQNRRRNSFANSSLLFRLRPDQLWSQTFGHCRNDHNNRRCSKKYSYYYYNLFYYPTTVVAAIAASTTTDNNNKLDKFDDKKRWNVAEDCQRKPFTIEDEEDEEEEENEDQEDRRKLLDNSRSSFRRTTNSIQRSTSCDNCIDPKSSLPSSLFTSLRHDHHHPNHPHLHPYHPYSRPHNGAPPCCPTTTATIESIESQLNQPLIHPTPTVVNPNLLLSRIGINSQHPTRPSPIYSNTQFHQQNPYQRYQSSKYCPLLLPHCHCHHLNRCISDSQSIETNLSGSLENSIASSLLFVDPNNQKNQTNSPNDPNSLSLSSSEEDEEDHHRHQNFSCLSTIMEILPLVLLLTMGVIISTTCAKYTFHSNSGSSTSASTSQSGPYSSAISSSHANNGSVLDYSNGPHHYHHHSSSHQYPFVNHHLESSGTSSDSERLQMQNDDEYSSSSSSSSHAQPQSASHHKSPQLQSASSSSTIDLSSSDDSTLDSTETGDDQSRTPKSSKPSYRSTYQSTGQSALSKSQHAANTPQQQQQLLAQFASQVRRQYSVMRLRWLSNSSVTCNDGTRAGYYVRHSPNSRRWLIYLEGGWYCVNKASCDQRWSKMREFMTSFRWAEYKTFNGILSASSTTNPHWWDANHVFIPYCSSDIWSGDSAPPNEMAFLGSRIIDEVIKELTRSPVYRFTDAKLVLLAGSSAGAAGVMINLDRVARMIGESGSKADVRGLADSGWILESDYFESQQQSKHQQQQPHQYGNKMPCIDSVHCSPMESIKGAFKMWKSRVPNSCVEQYPHEPWRCYFGYRLYPTLRTPLFVVQYQYDEFQIHMDGMNGRPLNEHEKMQYIRSLSEQIRITLTNVSAVFAPSCISHIMLTKPDWHKVSIRGVTLPDALNCWEQNPGAGNHHPSIGPGSQSPLYRSSYHHQNQPPKSSMSSILNTRYQQLYHKLASLQNHQNQQHNPFQSSNNNNNQYPGYKGSLPSYSIPIESISDNDEIVIDNSGDGSSDINGKNEEISNPYHQQTRPEDELSQFYSSNTGQISARYNSAQNLRSLSTHDLGVLLPPSSESIDFRQTNASASAASTGLGTSSSVTFYNSLLKSDSTVELGLMDEPKKISVYQHVPDLVTESSSSTSSVSSSPSSSSSVPEVDTTHHNRHTHHKHQHNPTNKHSKSTSSSSSSAPSVVSTFESQPGFKETNDLIIENFQPSSSKLFNNNNNNVISTTTSTTTATAASAVGGAANVSSMLNLTNPVTGKVSGHHQSHNNKKRKKRKRRKNQRRQHQQQQSNNNNSTNSKAQNNHQNNPNKRIHLDHSGTSRFSNSKTNNRNPAHNSHNHQHHHNQHHNQHQHQQQNSNQQSQNSRNRFTGIGNPYHLISSDWIESSGNRQCEYRLIDDHSFPKRNFDCPRFYKAYMD